MLPQTPLLEMHSISKSFGAVKAVQDIDLILDKGMALGLVGDNAAGKSTLMKVLAGFHLPDHGKILFEGNEVHIHTPHDARRLGIDMIYQDFSLAPNLSVSDNIFLGREITKKILGINWLDRKRMADRSREALNTTHIAIDSVQTLVTDLSGGQQQTVAIARATAFEAKLIIMDEPTASLSVKTIPPFLDMVVKLKKQGLGIVLITHRIQDIFSTCDSVMVLRHGRCAGVTNTKDTSIDEVTSLVTGTKESFEKGLVLSGD